MGDRIYLDHHATTPCDRAVVDAMLPYFEEHYGNAASRGHTWGTRARSAVEAARSEVATLVGCSPKELIWTSGATEANNLAILGAARARGTGHVVTIATEHKAVLDPVEQLRREGFETTVLPVDSAGRIAPGQIEAALRTDTILVSAMLVNNEIGTLHPIAALGAICRARGVLLHCDAAQAVHTQVDVTAMQVDLLSLSAHKMYGPKGIGTLYVRRGRPRIRLSPLFYGGGHERGFRSGTLPVPLIVGMGTAATLARSAHQDGVPSRIATLRDRLFRGLRAIEGVRRNGSGPHAPHNLNVTFDGVEASALLMGLKELAVSTGSACTSATLAPSHVLRAIGADPDSAHAAVRFGLGRGTTEAEIDEAIERITHKVRELRALAPLTSLG